MRSDSRRRCASTRHDPRRRCAACDSRRRGVAVPLQLAADRACRDTEREPQTGLHSLTQCDGSDDKHWHFQGSKPWHALSIGSIASHGMVRPLLCSLAATIPRLAAPPTASAHSPAAGRAYVPSGAATLAAAVARAGRWKQAWARGGGRGGGRTPRSVERRYEGVERRVARWAERRGGSSRAAGLVACVWM
jgi:hypothetical protein